MKQKLHLACLLVLATLGAYAQMPHVSGTVIRFEADSVLWTPPTPPTTNEVLMISVNCYDEDSACMTPYTGPIVLRNLSGVPDQASWMNTQFTNTAIEAVSPHMAPLINSNPRGWTLQWNAIKLYYYDTLTFAAREEPYAVWLTSGQGDLYGIPLELSYIFQISPQSVLTGPNGYMQGIGHYVAGQYIPPYKVEAANLLTRYQSWLHDYRHPVQTIWIAENFSKYFSGVVSVAPWGNTGNEAYQKPQEYEANATGIGSVEKIDIDLFRGAESNREFDEIGIRYGGSNPKGGFTADAIGNELVSPFGICGVESKLVGIGINGELRFAYLTTKFNKKTIAKHRGWSKKDFEVFIPSPLMLADSNFANFTGQLNVPDSVFVKVQLPAAMFGQMISKPSYAKNLDKLRAVMPISPDAITAYDAVVQNTARGGMVTVLVGFADGRVPAVVVTAFSQKLQEIIDIMIDPDASTKNIDSILVVKDLWNYYSFLAGTATSDGVANNNAWLYYLPDGRIYTEAKDWDGLGINSAYNVISYIQNIDTNEWVGLPRLYGSELLTSERSKWFSAGFIAWLQHSMNTRLYPERVITIVNKYDQPFFHVADYISQSWQGKSCDNAGDAYAINQQRIQFANHQQDTVLAQSSRLAGDTLPASAAKVIQLIITPDLEDHLSVSYTASDFTFTRSTTGKYLSTQFSLSVMPYDTSFEVHYAEDWLTDSTSSFTMNTAISGDGGDTITVTPILVPANQFIAGQGGAAEYKIGIWPNPTTGLINIMGEDIKQVSIFDIQGRQVFTTRQNFSGVQKFDIDNLSSGIYVVEVKAFDGVTTKKLTVQ